MRAATTVEGSAGSPAELRTFVVEAERLGLDVCWVAEAWGADGPSVLGYLAAATSRVQLGAGVLQLGVRTPAALAQTAISLSNLSEGRFSLGLGASGPQVIEGLHGVPFADPVGRMRETIEIVRRLAAGEKLDFAGRHHQLPRPGSQTRPMRLSLTPRHPIPLYLAALSPAMLRLAGELADGWLGTSFVPEASQQAYFDHLDEGLARSGRERAALDACQGAELALFDSEDEVIRHVGDRKRELAFSLGGMGTASTNFYNRAYSRQGWAEVAAGVSQAWQAGQREAAAALIPDAMVLATTLIGTEAMVRSRLQAWSDAGITTVRLYPAGQTLPERLATLERGIDLVHATTSRVHDPGPRLA